MRGKAGSGVPTTMTSIRLPAALVERLNTTADKRCISRSMLVSKAVERYLNELDQMESLP